MNIFIAIFSCLVAFYIFHGIQEQSKEIKRLTQRNIEMKRKDAALRFADTLMRLGITVNYDLIREKKFSLTIQRIEKRREQRRKR